MEDWEDPGVLAEKYSPMVYRLAYARTGSRTDAEDVVQEVFVKLLRSRPVFRDQAHCRAWLLRVAANCAGDLHRSPWRRRAVPLEEAGQVAAPEPPEEQGMEAAILTLPEDYRVVVHLYYYEELSTAEIAKVLGKRKGTIRTRLSRARAMLREDLQKGETPC